MSTLGSLGSVDVVWEADTTNLSSAIQEVSQSFAKVASGAGAANAAAQKSLNGISESSARVANGATAGIAQMQKSLSAMTQRADESAQHFQERVAAQRVALERLDGTLGISERAADGYRAAWAREALAQDRAAQAEKEAGEAAESAALKADILARSAAPVGNAFERMSLQVREALDGVGEQVAATAEKAELSADGIASAFGGVSKLVGASILGDFVGHMLDNVAELNVKLEDLHEKTGMAVQDLAGLRLLAQSKGLDFETISTAMTRMGNAMYEANHNMTEAQEAFTTLGISMKEVRTDTVAQMFYRVSAAIAENKSLVIDDGTALELFSRGGREIIPLLREFGVNLKEVSHQEGALAGMTDKSGAAAQQWLQTTQELSAELHAGLNPVLVDLVEVLPWVEAGFRALETGVTDVFGTIAEDAITAVEAIAKVGKAGWDLQSMNVPALIADVKSIPQFEKETKARYAALQSAINESAMQGMSDLNQALSSGDLVHPGAGLGDTGSGAGDGALLKQAKQQLADMERKHALTRAQLIKFWQQQLAKAQPGTVDYEQVNQVLGNLMQRAGSAGAVRAPAAPAVPVLRTKGSTPIEDAQRQAAKTAAASQNDAAKFQADRFEAALKANDAQVAAMREAQERLAKAIETGQLAGIRVAEANGQLSKFSAAVAEARVHAAAYAAQLADLDDQLARARSIPDLPGQKAEITRLEGQRQELVLSGQQQRTTDQAAMDSHTIAGASSQALAQMVQSWDDMATQIAETLKQTVGGFNDDIVKSLITPRLNHREIETMFGETARSGAGSLLKTGLQKGEAGLLGAFGVGGKLDGSSEASALWVRIAGAIDTGNKAAESIPGMSAIGRTVDKIFGGSGSGGSSVATLVTSGLNRIASPSMTAAAKLADSIFGPLPSGTGGAGASSEGPGVLPWAATSNSPATQQYLKAASSFADLLPGVNQPAGQDVDNLNTSGSTTVTRPSNATANAVSGMVTKLGGAVLSGIFQGAFAGGGDVLANRPALVGELGPELFVPRSAGTIVPNRQLGGSTTHNISIDARGANDPAQTEAAIHRAMRSYLPQAVSASVAAVRDRQLRRPSTSG